MELSTYKDIMEYLRVAIKGTVYEGKVFAVGGCERDKRLGNEIKDIDIVVSAPNGGIRFAQFLDAKDLTVWTPVVYEHFGTAMFCLKKFPDVEIEAVQTRKECYRDIDSRNPETAYGTIMDDCTRRDFTVNAFYYNISEDKELDLNGNSEKDLRDKLIRTCGDPEIIFSEDPLRVLRMVRFASRLGFEYDEKTFQCARKYVDRLSIISTERIHDELQKMFSTGKVSITSNAIEGLWDIGAFKYALPHLDAMRMKKRNEILNRLNLFSNRGASFEEVLALLLYDCPDIEDELRGLKCSNDEVNAVLFLVREAKKLENVMDENGDPEMVVIRRVMNECGEKRKFLIATLIGYGTYDVFHTEYYGVSLFDELNLLEDEYYTYQLPVDGTDVMSVLKIGPSKQVGDIMNRLWTFAFINKNEKDRQHLMDYLKYIYVEKRIEDEL